MRPTSLVLLICLLLVAGCAAGSGSTVQPAAPTPPATALHSPVAVDTTAAAPPRTARPTSTRMPTSTATPIPAVDLIAFETDRDGNAEIYLLDPAGGELTNLTRNPAEDRAPAWRPDGQAIAFQSHRDGNWELYVLDLASGETARLTQHPAYDGAPAWSPDGREIAFESYRDGNLELYAVPAGGGEPRRLTADPAGDYGPAWSPDGRTVAFTSWRDGNKEVYAVPAAGGEALNLTRNPADDENPAWAPDGSAIAFVSWRDIDAQSGNRNAEIYRLSLAGSPAERITDNPWPDLDPAYDAGGRLVWAAYDPGPPFETYDPFRPGDYHLYRAGPAGPRRLTASQADARRPAPVQAPAPILATLETSLPPSLPEATVQPTLEPGALVQVVEAPGILASDGETPVLVNELVLPSLLAWQEDVLAATGWDFLHRTLGSWRNIDSVRKKPMYAYDYGFLSWHKTGRALDLALEFNVDGVDQMLKVREDVGGQAYWRIYLRTAQQDGSQGEPLKDSPWLFWWQIVPESEPEAYAAGGKRLPVPDGYYVDVTALARRRGWERISSYAIEGDYHWKTDSNGAEYWHYECTGGLTWWQAMSQVYDATTLHDHVGWEVGLKQAQTEDMLRTKGVPRPTP